MSGRGAKRRGRPPKTPSMDRQANKFQYHLLKKPKYLMNRGSDSQLSTPTVSRASSPQGSDGSRRSISRPSTSRLASKRSCRGNKKRGVNKSRSSAPYARKGYESEYLYGSDFGDSSDEHDADDDLLMSPSETDSLIGDNESESDFSLSSFSNGSGTQKRTPRPPSPEPLWLQQKDLPLLEMPESSDDLLIPQVYSLKAASIYEVLRRFKYLVRLSPFRLEDFCAALLCEDQSVLLTEIHVMLMKAILREEDSQATHFGPLDQKDSVNISLYLIDQITWPEILKSYVESDLTFDKNVMNVLSTKEYPYTGIADRLTVLQFLTDQFLITTAVRDDMLQEGPIHYDDHCRICHRLGDLLCCETCPSVFHLECVDPPLVDVPTEDWQCNICKSHQLSGVYDCISIQEKQGMLCRQEHLGFDRHGRKYWFIGRRIFVEDEHNSAIWYYSSVIQLELLLSKLDSKEMELSLYRELADFKEEIIRQMQITESLTDQHKGNKKSYLEIENQYIQKLLKNENSGESGKFSAENMQNTSLEDASVIEYFAGMSEDNDITDMDYDSDNSKTSVSDHQKKSKIKLKTAAMTRRTSNVEEIKRKRSNDDIEKLGGIDTDTRMTRQKVNQISSGTLVFRLGMDNSFKSYVNQFTTNTVALNKPQRNEERDKKRHLSHKFSLTTASEFKWIGVLNGTQNNIVATIRQTILSLEQAIVSPFMHPNWSSLRKTWVSAVTNCSTPTDFANIIYILLICMKNPVFANVWHEQLGHIKLQRITSNEREEKKKLEKREKRERDDEEERNRLAINFVKYSLGLKHQVWKQKGEEYRIHGQWGWIWMSYGRRNRENTAINYIVPEKVMVKIRHKEINKIVSVKPNTLHFFIEDQKQNDIKQDCMSKNVPIEYNDIKITTIINKFDNIDVSRALTAPGRLLYPKLAKKSKLDELLARRIKLRDIEEQQLQTIQDEENIGVIGEDTTAPFVATETLTKIEKQLTEIAGNKLKISSINPSQIKTTNINMDLVNSLAERIQSVRMQFGQLNRFSKLYKCYTKECNKTNTNVFSLPQASVITCYSPLCLQKFKVKRELLILLRKAHTASNGSNETAAAIMNVVNKKPSILKQKLTEGKIEQRSGLSELQTNKILQDPTILQKDFIDAITNAYKYDEYDVNECITLTKSEDIKTELKTEKTECSDDKQFNSSEPIKCVEVPFSDKIPIDDSDIQEVKRRRLNDSVSDIDVISTTTTQSDDDENQSPRTRLSQRNVKSKTITNTTTTTTISRTKTEFDDGFVEQESNTVIKSRSSEINSTMQKVSTSINSHVIAGHTKYVVHPNRRFTTTKTIKKEDVLLIVKEYGPNGSERIYTKSSSNGKVYLKKTHSGNSSTVMLPKTNTSKYPVLNSFLTRKCTRSLMVLPQHDLWKLARNGGKSIIYGFHHLAKTNMSVWPYSCSRPLFKTSWFYRTMNVKTLAAIALQLRIVWCCLKWDDMSTKPPTTDGKHQVTTETEIMSLEILKHRHCGRFSEKTQYLRRKVVIPLELPKTIREFTSIRSGLRKRKRAESPQKTEPQVTEEWVDEDKLELWEIKQFGEKQEKSNIIIQPVTRTATGKLPPQRSVETVSTNAAPSNTSLSSKIIVGHKASPEEIKEKMEQQLRLQRAAHHQKRALEMQKSNQDTTKPHIIGQRKIVIKNADGTTKITQQNISAPPPKQQAVGTNDSAQKVQIIRGPDGKLSVRGLNPGQQLIQMPDGKLHVLTTNQSGAQSKTVLKSTSSPKTIITKQIAPHQAITKSPVLIRQQLPSSTTVVTKTITKPQTQKVVVSGGQIVTATTTEKVQIPSQSKLQISNTQQKIITSKGQLITTNAGQKVVQTTNLQQLLTQGSSAGHKVVINQTNTNNKLVITSTQKQSIQNLPQQSVQAEPMQHIVVQPAQKLVQQTLKAANSQQQIVVGGQRIILSPGQRVVTQQIPVSQQQNIVQQPSIQQQNIVNQMQTQPQIVFKQQIQQEQPQQPVLQQITQQVQQPTQPNVLLKGSSIAQQLAQGKLQIAHVDGEQFILKPIGNNQAQIIGYLKVQSNGRALIASPMEQVSDTNEVKQVIVQQPQYQQTRPQLQKPLQHIQIQQSQHVLQINQQRHQSPITQQPAPQQPAPQQTVAHQSVPQQTAPQQTTPQQPSPQQQSIQQSAQQQISPQQIAPQQQVPIHQQAIQTQQHPTIEQTLLQGQPPGTVIKCVTAQVIQTQQGPRIVLQGLTGNDFTPQQLSLVQQQVKQQLLKAQESTGKQGVLGPTKIYLAVQPTQPPPAQPNQPPPLTPVQSPPQHQNQPLSNPEKQQKTIINGAPASVDVKKELIQKVLLNNKLKLDTQPHREEDTQDNSDSECNLQNQDEMNPDDDSFVVTPDYIQQTIKNALKQENLNPEIEEKLLNLQRYQEKQMKSEFQPAAVVPSPNYHQYTSPVKPPVCLKKRPLSRAQDDEEWILDTPKRRSGKISGNTFERKLNYEQTNKISPVEDVEMSINNRRLAAIKRESDKKKQQQQLQIRLYRHKEQLKKDILKKRALLEKDLQIEIQKELAAEMASRVKQGEVKTNAGCGSSKRRNVPSPTKHVADHNSEFPINESSSSTRNRKHIHKMNTSTSNPGLSKKKQKLYCVCRTPYDDSKFYVGCDLCNNWYHGECVGITEEGSKNLLEFVCGECKHARDTQELYCLCRQPYDESQFYICCDKCQDWFHGRCVGILQSEADFIDEYICPNCQRNNAVNFANMKSLSQLEYENLKKLIKQIQTHKSSWPFMEPVDPDEAPDYYRVIKDPMDLQKIEKKINDCGYTTLSEFIGDMTKIFDNCRYYNPKESQFYRCAESLEGFFVQKIKFFRENLVDKTP